MIWYCCKSKHLKIYLSTNFRNYRNREVTLSNVHASTSEFTLPHSEALSMYVLSRGCDYTVTINRKGSVCVNILVRKVLCFMSVWTHLVQKWFRHCLRCTRPICNKQCHIFVSWIVRFMCAFLARSCLSRYMHPSSLTEGAHWPSVWVHSTNLLSRRQISKKFSWNSKMHS